MHNKTEELAFGEINYSRYTDRSPEHERGTIVLHGPGGDRVIKDYPHIARVYRLEEGIKRFFGSDLFFVEEKLDGYNVRIISHGDEIIAVTRGGFICPFSTEWVDHWRKNYRLDEFFKLYPDRIICAEFVGDNPYNSKRDRNLPPGLSFYCFDIMRDDGRLLPVEEKYEIFRSLGLPQVPFMGESHQKDFGRLKDIILGLNAGKREGVVLKGTHGNRSIKFVTAESDLNDIEKSLEFFYDIEPGFYSNRIMRIALFVQEFKLDEKLYKKKLGESLLGGYSFLTNYESSLERFTIYIHSLDTWRALKKLIIEHKDIVHDVNEPCEINGELFYKIVFKRKHKKSTDRYHEILNGHEE